MKLCLQGRFSYSIAAGLITICLLAACSGGGSGSSGFVNPPAPSNQSPSSPAPEPTGPTAEVDMQNAEEVSFRAISIAEQTMQIGAAAYAEVVSFGALPSIPLAKACRGGGVKTLQVIDNDNSSNLNAGDQLTIVYENCLANAIFAELNGRVELMLDTYSIDRVRDVYNLRGRLTIDNLSVASTRGPVLAASGAIDLELDRGIEMQRLAVSGDELAFVDELADSTDRILDFEFVKQYDFIAARNEILLDGTLNNSQLDGTLNYSSVQAIGARFDEYPTSGAFRFAAANSTDIVVAPNTAGNLIFATVSLVSDGLTDAVASERWADRLSFWLWSYPLNDQIGRFISTDPELFRIINLYPPLPATFPGRAIFIRTNQDIVFHFSDPIAPDSLPATFTLEQTSGTPTSHVLNVEHDGASLRLTPASPLPAQTTFTGPYGDGSASVAVETTNGKQVTLRLGYLYRTP